MTASRLTFESLYNPRHLRDLYHEFLDFYRERDPAGYEAYREYAQRTLSGDSPGRKHVSAVLLNCAEHVENFLVSRLDLMEAVRSLYAASERELRIVWFKREFVKKTLLRRKNIVPHDPHLSTMVRTLLEKSFEELPWEWDYEYALAEAIYRYKLSPEEYPQISVPLDVAELGVLDYVVNTKPSGWITSKTVRKTDHLHLLHGVSVSFDDDLVKYTARKSKKRLGFDLTDDRGTAREVTGELEYCMICHEREKDSCSTGFHDNGEYKKNPLGVSLTGCPLEERISEMHLLKLKGLAIGALAMITLDNPMCAGTGHRICNDCMKGCIFQKQDPVNIPKVETNVLTDVLSLPLGFELYSLLTKWNPLNVRRPYPLEYNGKKVLVVGLGPAGYTLSHYLLNEGFAVVAVDGLKIEPAKVEDPKDESYCSSLISDYKGQIEKPLSERVQEGFGGVSEYGITVRWDKNFLTVLHLILERRSNFRILDGTRFGGTLNIDDAWQLGFDHIALALGAGRPTIISVKNNMARGMRKASDFLMALQLTGAARKRTVANLLVELPIVVIGGGLTAIDTATESAAYYIVQIKEIQAKLSEMSDHARKDFFDSLDVEESAMYQRFLSHAVELAEREAEAQKSGEKSDYNQLIRLWGGVTIAYRKSIYESPAYRLNHEEIVEALGEGVSIIEGLSPVSANLDQYGAVSSMTFEAIRTDEHGNKSKAEITLEARSVFIAAGTSPNTTYEKEYPGTFQLNDRTKYFKGYAAIKRQSLATASALVDTDQVSV